jgi:AAA domain, putative AbiEii toxin, Type IV TA system/AAA ATPase domain
MYLTEITIENLKLLRNFRLELGDKQRPRLWTVLIGENGLCKTSILRAIAMAAVGEVRANQLADVPSLFDRRRRSDPSAELKVIGGFVTQASARDRPGMVWELFQKQHPGVLPKLNSFLRVTFERKSTVVGNSCWAHPQRIPASTYPAWENPNQAADPIAEISGRNLDGYFVAGYGIQRKLPDTRSFELPSDPVLGRLASLFDQGQVIGTNFAAILKDVEGFTRSLRKALIDSDLLPHARDVQLRGKNWASEFGDLVESSILTLDVGGQDVEMPASWLSPGYQSLISLIADIVGHFFLAKKGVVELDDMEGLVLVDELDLHLHPRWQMGLIPAMKRVFPRLQFVVTTHSPLILAGAKREEIVILRQDEDGNVVGEEASEHPGLLTASQILASYFDVDRREPARLGGLARRYFLLQANAQHLDVEDRRELAQLRGELVAAGIDPELAAGRGAE